MSRSTEQMLNTLNGGGLDKLESYFKNIEFESQTGSNRVWMSEATLNIRLRAVSHGETVPEPGKTLN